MARKELDQFFGAEPDSADRAAAPAVLGAVSLADGDGARPGRPRESRPAATGLTAAALARPPGDSPALPPFPPRLPVAAVVTCAAVAVALGARAPGLIVQVSAVPLLTVFAARQLGWLLRARRAPGPAGQRLLAQAASRLALALSLLWIAWVAARAWQDVVLAVAALALTLRLPGWPGRGRDHRGRAGPPPGRALPAWAVVGMLAALNAAVALALLDTARFPFGSWAVHTKIAFLLMGVLDVLLLKYGLAGGRKPTKEGLARNYVLVPRADRGTPHERRRRWLPRLRVREKARPWLAAASVALAFGIVGYTHPGPLAVLTVLVVGAAVLALTDVSVPQAVTMLLAIGFGVGAADYMGWRIAVTNWPGWWMAVPLLLAEMLGAIHTLGFQLTVWPWRPPAVAASGELGPRQVFMLIATLNEGPEIVRPTVRGCLRARAKYLEQWPGGEVTIIVCNDGLVGGYPRWAEIEDLAAELGVRCLSRSVPGGAKAGNIENARQQYQITGERLLVIFDADQVPAEDFLVKTVPPFADPDVGWVQTGQYYANLANPVSRWADDQQSMFYNLLCPGKAALNSAFICGTNVVLRGAALDEIGGLPQDSVTEDFAASILLHPRWRSIYLTDILATGLGPLDVPSYLKQQGRWALGTLSAFRDHWADILLPRRGGLRLGQRVQYFLAATHYLCGLRDLIYLVCPAVFIFTGVPAVRTATLDQYMLHFLPYAVLGLGGMWYCGRGVTGLRGVIIGFGSTPALLSSLIATLTFRRKPFAVTSKSRSGRQSHRYLAVYVLSLALCLTAVAWATQVHGRQVTSMFISLLWVVYSMLLLLSFLWLALRDIRARRAADDEVLARTAYPHKMHTRGSVVRPVLNAGMAALIASPLLFGLRLAGLPVFNPPAPPFTISPRDLDARQPGVSLPLQELATEPPALERELGARFSIVARTEVVGDQFDTRWANGLAAQGARPWVFLQFGAPGAGGRAPLAASLPAIYNGVNDAALRRWAGQIRAYGKPVYLTVLLQVDKNWAVSSAVANGGIPQDVPKAWLHIQSVFRTAGADNVAWVWAPADPLHDQRYAPPAASITLVLQDFINYPGTRWGDPGQALASLVRRYPGKPIVVEVASAGPPAAKAAWLARLARALDACPQVYAVVYHEGGPLLKPTAAQLKEWSEASDPRSLAQWKSIIAARGTAGS